jgi:uncharacterized protein (DUF885 family)
LKHLHESELAELELASKASEISARQDNRNRIRSAVDREKQASRDELRLALKSISQSMSREVGELEAEHRASCSNLELTQSKELANVRHVLETRNKKERSRGEEQILHLKESIRSKIQSLLARHAEEIADLRGGVRKVLCAAPTLYRVSHVLRFYVGKESCCAE